MQREILFQFTNSKSRLLNMSGIVIPR